MSEVADDDQILQYARKRQRRNAIKPNSLESVALRDFSLQAQLSGVSLADTSGSEAVSHTSSMNVSPMNTANNSTNNLLNTIQIAPATVFSSLFNTVPESSSENESSFSSCSESAGSNRSDDPSETPSADMKYEDDHEVQNGCAFRIHSTLIDKVVDLVEIQK